MTEKMSAAAPAGIPKTCLYRCNGLQWELVEGIAPFGYYCPNFLGSCDVAGEEILHAPTPIRNLSLDGADSSSATMQAVSPNTGRYEFDVESNSLYFSSGIADKGYRFLTKISLTELREKFPEIAADIEVLKNTKSVLGFSVEVPAVPTSEQS